MPYVHAPAEDYEALDPIRRNAIEGILARVKYKQSNQPRETYTAELEFEKLKTIKPKTYTAREPLYTFVGEFKPKIIDTPASWYSMIPKTAIDDYGNEVNVRERQPNNYRQ